MNIGSIIYHVNILLMGPLALKEHRNESRKKKDYQSWQTIEPWPRKRRWGTEIMCKAVEKVDGTVSIQAVTSGKKRKGENIIKGNSQYFSLITPSETV